MTNFVHLHVHTHYSLLDGLAKIDPLLEKAKELGYDALAITDHGVMYGVIEFYQKAKKLGIKPIIGCEIYLAPRSMDDKTAKVDTDPAHLVLLAKDNIGYKNLIKIVTQAHLRGYYYKPRVDKKFLKQNSKGLIALTACLQGELPKAASVSDLAGLKKLIEDYQDIFGKENFYLELQDHPELEKQKIVNKILLKMSHELGVPVVATADVHYIDYGDAPAHDILLCVQTGKHVQDKDRLSFKEDGKFLNMSLRSPQEMADAFKEIPEALENTVKIAQQCNVEIEFGKYILPKFNPPKNLNQKQYLELACWRGLVWRYLNKKVPSNLLCWQIQSKYADKIPKNIVRQLRYELKIIEKTGYISYFLIVADFVNWAKNHGILVGPGRGSAAGSIVSYVLNITDIDPISYNLVFERFLNPERISPPDIDLDFADDRRDEVIDYVAKKYGKEHVAQIVTFGTMASRAAVRDTGRALGMAYGDVDVIAKLVPFNMPLAQALEKVPELREKYETEPRVKKLLDTAQKLEGVARHASMHAAGVVIADQPLINYVPLQRATKNDDNVITQYPMHNLEDLGLLKMDFLGLANLTIIQKTIEICEKTKNIRIDLNKIPQDDPLTYSLLSRGETTGVFQLESEGMKRYLKMLKPTNFEDIISMVALYRPGPMDSITDFIAGKHGRKEISYLHPKLKPILEKTYGVIVTQEQVLEIARKFAGFSYAEADILRKAVGKKIKKLLLEQRKKFISGAIKHGAPPEIARKVWNFIEPFARYGFNRAHAACYAQIAYQTAYLKAHYPAEFMAALLTSDQENIDRISIEVAECKRMGITILPPDVNESFGNFTVIDDKTIRFGLGAIKNVGTGAVEAIIKARKKAGAFKNLEDFCRRVEYEQINKKVLEGLIKSGALDALGERGQMLIGVNQILKFAKTCQEGLRCGQIDLFGQTQDLASQTLELPKVEKVPERQRLAWEKELLGIYVSEHPLSAFIDYLKEAAKPISELNGDLEGQRFKIGGIITKTQKVITRTGEPMVFAKLEDTASNIEVLVFPKLLAQNSTIWQEDNVVLVTGKVSTKDGQIKILADTVEEVGEQMSLSQKPKVRSRSSDIPTLNSDTKKLILTIPQKSNKALLNQIKELILAYPGNQPVVLRVPAGEKYKEIQARSRVEINKELVSKLEVILEKEAVKIA